jgi:hypothetical protein
MGFSGRVVFCPDFERVMRVSLIRDSPCLGKQISPFLGSNEVDF